MTVRPQTLHLLYDKFCDYNMFVIEREDFTDELREFITERGKKPEGNSYGELLYQAFRISLMEQKGKEEWEIRRPWDFPKDFDWDCFFDECVELYGVTREEWIDENEYIKRLIREGFTDDEIMETIDTNIGKVRSFRTIMKRREGLNETIEVV